VVPQRPIAERGALAERARALIEQARAVEQPRDLLLGASTLLEARLAKRHTPSEESLRQRIAALSTELDRRGGEAHAELFCRESERARARVDEHLARGALTDADLAQSAAELLFRRSFHAGEIDARDVGDVDLGLLEQRVAKLRGQGRHPAIAESVELELTLAREAMAKGSGDIAGRSAARAHKLLQLGASLERNRPSAGLGLADRERPLDREFARFDQMLSETAPRVGEAPRHRELYRRAVEHQSRARRWVVAGQPRRAHREIVDGTRLLLRLIEESRSVDLSADLAKLDELLVVARERVEGLPADARARALLLRAERLRAEAEAGAADPKRAKESANTAQEILFEVLSLTRDR